MRLFGALTVGQNTFAYLSGTALGRVAVLIFMVLAAQRLGPAEFGTYGFIVAYLAFFRLVGNLGLTPILSRELARGDRDAQRRIAGTALTLKLGLAAIAIAGAVGVIAIASHDQELVAATAIASIGLVGVVGELYAAFLQAKNRLQLVALAETIQLFVWAIVGAALVLAGWGLTGVVIALVAGNLAQLALLAAAGSRRLPLRPALDPVLARGLLRQALPLAVMAAFSVVLLRVDVLLLFALRSKEEVGLYTAAVRIAEPVLVLSTAFTASVYPRLSRWYVDDRAMFERVRRLGAKYLLAVIVPVVVAGVLLSEDLVGFLYGPAYATAARPFAILLVAELFLFLEIFNTYVLIASDRQSLASAFTIVGGVVNVALNLALIQTLGIEGAAIASLVSYAGYFALQAVHPATRGLSLTLVGAAVRPALSALALALVVVALKRVAWPVAAIAAPIAYLIALAALRGLSRAELRALLGSAAAPAPLDASVRRS
jgi:O-antigen/teichoic acid export membrane protein